MSRAPLNAPILLLLVALFHAAAWGSTTEIFYEQYLAPYPVPIMVPVQFGDHVRSFLLDTGCSKNMCDLSLRESLGPQLGHIEAATPAGEVDVPFYRAPTMSLGRGHLPAAPVGVKDFAWLRKATGFNIRGVLGSESFKGSAIWLDFDHQKLRLGQHLNPTGMKSMDLELGPDGASPYLTLNLAGRKIRFCIDLGFNGVVGLSDEMCREFIAAGLIKESKDADEVSVTLGGKSSARSGRFVKGELLGHKLTNVSIGNKGDFNLLGVEFLLNFNVIIDLENMKFYYKPRKALPPVNLNSMLGAIVFCDDGCGLVYKMRPGRGPARAAGLREGDRLLRLGPVNRGQFNVATLYELGLYSAGKFVDAEVKRPGWSDPFYTRVRIGGRPRPRYLW